MSKKLILVLVVCVFLPRLGNGQEPKAALDGVVKAMGDVKSLQYAGNGAYFFLGQSPSPGAAPPRFNLKSYTRTVDYDTPSMRDEFVRTQAEPGARGGGGVPLVGEQRQFQGLSGAQAWNQVGDASPTPQPAAVADRLHQLWITPHGVIKAAMKHNATVEGQTTAHYIADRAATTGARISRLAQGVPIGGELDYLDEGTLTAALKTRRLL